MSQHQFTNNWSGTMALKKNPKYDLRRKYNRTLKICMVISLTLLIAAFKLVPELKTNFEHDVDAQELITALDVPLTEQNTTPPPPPKPPIPIEQPDDIDDLPDIEIQNTEIDEKETMSAPPPPIIEDNETEPVFEFILIPEVLPQPIGGIKAIMDKIEYPDFAKRAGIYGMVSVSAYVDESGTVVKAEILKGIGAGCDEEALEAVLDTKFIPGEQRGKKVKVKMTVPIKFVLR